MPRTSSYIPAVLAGLLSSSAIAASLPIPSSPSGDISLDATGLRVTGRFERTDGACRVALAAGPEFKDAIRVQVTAGGKSRVTLADRELEVFCCPELKLVTLREVRRVAVLSN